MKNTLKALIMIQIVVLVIIGITSCGYGSGHDRLDVNFKRDTQANYGAAAAVYNDRIYYVSNELGIAGVYSMNPDGSDVRLEVDKPSIKGLEIRDDVLYYNGVFRINEPTRFSPPSSAINDHSIHSLTLGKEKSGKVGGVDYRYNVTGFYLSQNGYRVISYRANELSLYDKDAKIVDRSTIREKVTRSFETGDTEVKIDIYEFGDFIILSSHYPDDYTYDRFAGNNPCVLDTVTGNLVLTCSHSTQYNELQAFYMDNNNIYCSSNEMIIILDRTTYQVKSSFMLEELTDDYYINYMVHDRNNIYVAAKKHNKFVNPYDKLYKINMDTKECSEIININRKERVLGLADEHIIFLDHKEIYKIDLSNGVIGDRQKLCDAPADIHLERYIIDYAGEWMFIYKSYPRERGSATDPGQQLLKKINLQTGEVIENDIELDFSVLDKYR